MAGTSFGPSGASGPQAAVAGEDLTEEPREVDLTELALDAEIAQSVALAEKFQHEAEYARWQAEREKLSYLHEKMDHAWQTDGVYSFDAFITRKSANKLLHAMTRWHQYNPVGDWTILLNSGGGDEWATYSIIDQLRPYSLRGGGAHKIEIRVAGIAGSGAGMLLQAADHRVMGRYARLMIHKPMAMGRMNLTADQLGDEVDYMRVATDMIVNLFLERTDKVTRPEFLRKVARKDWWLSATEAVALGFADAVS